MLSYINFHGFFALLTVLMGLLQKDFLQNKAYLLSSSSNNKNTNVSTFWNTNQFWVFHKYFGCGTISCTLIFAILGWIASDYSSWTYFSSNAKYWLFYPYIIIIPLVLFPLKTNIFHKEKRIFYHRMMGNLYIKLLFLAPFSRMTISLFQKINIYKHVWIFMGYQEMINNRLFVKDMNEYNYYYAVSTMALINVPWQIYDMYKMYQFVKSNHKSK